MSRFGDLRKGVTKTPAIETPVVDTTPSSVEEPPRPEEEVADAVSAEKKFTDMSKEHASKKMFMLTLARVVIIDFGMAILPTYVNYINTSYQHGRISSEEYNIPSCFDD